jgi:hypothetical protein
VFKRILVAGSTIVATLGPIVLGAQVVPPAPDAPTFEAASIRPAADTRRRGGRGTPGRFTGFNLPARQLIRQGYDIHDAQIVGGPDWLDSQGKLEPRRATVDVLVIDSIEKPTEN